MAVFLGCSRGHRKDFVISAIHNFLESKGINFLAVATSAVAAQLLCKRRTAHSTFCTPIPCNEDSLCHINVSSYEASMLEGAILTIWDVMVICKRHNVEAICRTLKYLIHINLAFQGK